MWQCIVHVYHALLPTVRQVLARRSICTATQCFTGENAAFGLLPPHETESAVPELMALAMATAVLAAAMMARRPPSSSSFSSAAGASKS